MEPHYVVALLPLDYGTPAPAMTTESFGRATQLRLGWGAVDDLAVVNPTDSMAGGPLQTDGRLALVRSTEGGIAGYALAEGRSLRRRAFRVVTLDRRASVTMSGSTLHVDRQDLGFAAWGPEVTRVVGPQGDVPFTRWGDWVRDVAAIVAVPEDPPPAARSTRFAVRLDCSVDPGAPMRVAVHDVRGRLVRVLGRSALAPSRRSCEWDGRDTGGRRVAAGIYFARVHACGHDTVRRIAVVR